MEQEKLEGVIEVKSGIKVAKTRKKDFVGLPPSQKTHMGQEHNGKGEVTDKMALIYSEV